MLHLGTRVPGCRLKSAAFGPATSARTSAELRSCGRAEVVWLRWTGGLTKVQTLVKRCQSVGPHSSAAGAGRDTLNRRDQIAGCRALICVSCRPRLHPSESCGPLSAPGYLSLPRHASCLARAFSCPSPTARRRRWTEPSDRLWLVLRTLNSTWGESRTAGLRNRRPTAQYPCEAAPGTGTGGTARLAADTG